jgi:hypothetical protein
MDIRDPSSSPHGAVFMPSLPETLTELVDEPFSPNLGADFEDYALNSSNRALTSRRRAEIKEILRHPDIRYSKADYPNGNDRDSLKTGQNYTLNSRTLRSTVRLRRFMDSPTLHDMLYVCMIQVIETIAAWSTASIT